MNSLRSRKIYRDQSGIISILVVSILTITLSLIAIGFSQLADRELRQASDREQSSQAYYAAQSGLNDAIAYVSAGGEGFPGCTPTYSGTGADPAKYFTQDLSSGAGTAKYSCVRIDTTPTELKADPVTPGQPTLLKVSANNLTNLYIGWQNVSYPSGIKWLPGGAGNPLPPEDSAQGNGATGVLRVGLYEVPKVANPDSAGLTCDTNTNNCLSSLSSVYYLYPNHGSGHPGTVPYAPLKYSVASGPTNPNGSFVNGNCKTRPFPPNPVPTKQYCNGEITNLDGTNNIYYLYLTAQYAEVNVSVQGTDGTNHVKFIDSQATVDVTGQGSGIIQRIQATVNLGSSFGLPNYAVQSMETLCKNFTIEIFPPSRGVLQYGSATPKENPDNSCFAPAGGGSIIGGGTGGH